MNRLFLKTSVACLAGLLTVASAGIAHGQTVLYQWTFNSSGDVSGYWDAIGASDTLTFLPGVAPAGQSLSSGSMEVSGQFGPSSTQNAGFVSYLNPNPQNMSAGTELSFWIDVFSGYDSNGQIQDLHPGLGIGGYQYASPSVPISSAYNTWENVVIPAADIESGNWSSVADVVFNPYDGNYTTPTTLTFAIDNVQILQVVPEPSPMLLGGLGVAILGLVSGYRRARA